MIEAALSLIVGSLVTWYVSWRYYDKAVKEQKEEAKRLYCLIDTFIEKQAETQFLLMRTVGKLEKANPEEARSLEEEISTNRTDVAEVVQKAVSVLDSIPLDSTTKCYQCGKAARPQGFAGGPGGGWVMWYHCPEHGRFPRGHMDDMYDD